MIPFNKPHLTGKEFEYIAKAMESGKISGNGLFTKKCHAFFKQVYNFGDCLLTTSCTDALEMAALLLELKPGDEVILPSFSFVSTANAFMLRGANIIFADSSAEHPNIDPDCVEKCITEATKAIVIVHYAGMACDMDKLMSISKKHNVPLIEDAAQAIHAYYKGKPLGSFGDMATFSFHETKNVLSGEGGLLVMNNKKYIERAEILWEKGTNRASFYRGEVEEYNWLDLGSSYLPSELTAAFLYAQLEHVEEVTAMRLAYWQYYNDHLVDLEQEGKIKLPKIPSKSSNNGHIFYIICSSLEERKRLIAFLYDNGIMAVFHYLPLHKSPYYLREHKNQELPNAQHYGDCLLRLPLFYEITEEHLQYICSKIKEFYR